MSIDVGCVRLTEKFLEHDPPQPEELTACISCADAYLDDVRARASPAAARRRTLVGLAGTITTVAAVEIGLATYDRDAHPPLRAHPGRGRGRVPHARHRVAAPTGSTTPASRRRGPT